MISHLCRVKTSYPNEGEHISSRQGEIKKLWATLEDKATERKAQLAQSRDITTFHNDTKELVSKQLIKQR